MISTQRATRCTSVRRHTRGCGTGSPCHHAHAPGRSRPAWANNVVTMNPACGILKQKTHIRPREQCVRVRTSVCERRLKENVKGRVSTWRVEETLSPSAPTSPKVSWRFESTPPPSAKEKEPNHHESLTVRAPHARRDERPCRTGFTVRGLAENKCGLTCLQSCDFLVFCTCPWLSPCHFVMRSMVQLDAFLVRYVIMNRLEKKKREREREYITGSVYLGTSIYSPWPPRTSCLSSDSRICRC